MPLINTAIRVAKARDRAYKLAEGRGPESSQNEITVDGVAPTR